MFKCKKWSKRLFLILIIIFCPSSAYVKSSSIPKHNRNFKVPVITENIGYRNEKGKVSIDWMPCYNPAFVACSIRTENILHNIDEFQVGISYRTGTISGVAPWGRKPISKNRILKGDRETWNYTFPAIRDADTDVAGFQFVYSPKGPQEVIFEVKGLEAPGDKTVVLKENVPFLSPAWVPLAPKVVRLVQDAFVIDDEECRSRTEGVCPGLSERILNTKQDSLLFLEISTYLGGGNRPYDLFVFGRKGGEPVEVLRRSGGVDCDGYKIIPWIDGEKAVVIYANEAEVLSFKDGKFRTVFRFEGNDGGWQVDKSFSQWVGMDAGKPYLYRQEYMFRSSMQRAELGRESRLQRAPLSWSAEKKTFAQGKFVIRPETK